VEATVSRGAPALGTETRHQDYVAGPALGCEMTV
jgi:hypothetical protein